MKFGLGFVCLFVAAVFCQESTKVDETTPIDLCANGTEDSCEAFNSSEILTDPPTTNDVTKPPSTTKKPKTTTSKTNVSGKKSYNAVNVTVSLKPHPDCLCDTTRGGCEINCCCDVDCSVDQQAVFTRCVRTPHIVDSEHCFPQELLYRNNTDYQTVQTDPGVLCVLHQTALVSTDYTDVSVIRTMSQLEKKLGQYKYYSWTNPLPTSQLFDTELSYSHDSPVWISDNITITQLELPASMGSSSLCLTSVVPKYLHEFESSCTQQMQTEQDCLATKNKDFSFISSPRSFNFTQPQECTEDVCLPIQQYLCSDSCSKRKVPQSVFNKSFNICQNVVDSVEYKIYHNGSQGIVEVKAYYTLRNISVVNAQLFRRQYKVSYLWAGGNEQIVLKRSGRPGYEIGKPVISGKRIDKRIIYNSSDSYWISIGVAGSSGHCEKRYNILFDDNVRTQCLLKINGSCKEMQQQIWDQLLGPAANLSDVVISSYGDPRGKDKDAWVPVLSTDPPSAPALTTVVDIVIVHSLVGHVASPQAKIIAVYLNLLPSTETCKSNHSTVAVETSVRFIDKTTPAITKFAQPPVYEIKLPRDFFYPFLSAGNKLDCKKVIVLLTVLHLIYM